jgi:hypothetical protein
MVIAGIRNKKTKGPIINSPSILAYPKSRILNCVGNTKRNNPLIRRKTVIVRYPVSELKKLLISFLNNASISSVKSFGRAKLTIFLKMKGVA